MPRATQPRTGYLVSDVRQIAALASPVRQDIVDTVAALGPSSVAAIANALRRSAAGLYYHVEQLEAVGLVRSVPEIDELGRAAVRLELPGQPLTLRYEPGNSRNRKAVGRVVATMLRSTLRRFTKAFARGDVAVSGARRDLWAARTRGALTATQLAEFNRHLRRALKVLNDAREQAGQVTPGRLYEFTFVMTPVVPDDTRS